MLVALARAAGFTAVVDLSDAYDGLDPAALAIGPDDYHPNADGHARLARRLDAGRCATGSPSCRRAWRGPATGPTWEPTPTMTPNRTR